MQKPEHLERVAYEFGVDNYDEGVLYFEVRFAPQLHATREMDVETVLISVSFLLTLCGALVHLQRKKREPPACRRLCRGS